MSEPSKQQTNPYSSGGGGPNFETRVQAAFVILLLTGRVAPCLPPFHINKLILQGRYAGFETDDLIVVTKDSKTEKEAKLLAQVKHEVNITAKNKIFGEVVQSTWNDFNKDDFNCEIDSFALITGPLSSVDTKDVRPILEWARHSESEDEFLFKVASKKFSSDSKRTKLEAFKTQLKVANNKESVTDEQLWKYLKVFHLVGYDLDLQSGSTLSLIQSLIAQNTSEAPHLVWSKVVDVIQTSNQNAGTITLENLPNEVTHLFDPIDSSTWSKDVTRLKDHGNLILNRIDTTIGNVHVEQKENFLRLIDLAESNKFVFVTGDRGVGKSSLIRKFADESREQTPIFCLRAEDFEQPHLDHVYSAIGLTSTLSELHSGFALLPKKYLIIESLEKILELRHEAAFKDLLFTIANQQEWTIIATGREYAFQPIVFEYLEPSGIEYATLSIGGFSDDQIEDLCLKAPILKNLAANTNLKPLLNSPFFAQLAYKVLQTGTEFSVEDGEREFRDAVWRNVIAQDQKRATGMPIKRTETFVEIALTRAKLMVYGVPEAEFDSEVLLKLEADNLVRRDSSAGLVSPAHDVLEDWALERFIEKAFTSNKSDIQAFFNEIGHEPAMNRAFRLWLHQKLRFGEDVSSFIESLLFNQEIARYWQDSTIAAILLGDNSDIFLQSLSKQLLDDKGALLKRFCFILRIACQTPDPDFSKNSLKDQNSILANTLILRPFGKSWQGMIYFLYQNRGNLDASLQSHVISILDDWVSMFRVYEQLPAEASNAGLLALYLLENVKDSYQDESGDRKKLLSIIIRTASTFPEGFLIFLEENKLGKKVTKRSERPKYSEDFYKMAFEGIPESRFLAHHFPETLIQMAENEWYFERRPIPKDTWYHHERIDVAECFGLHQHKYEFFPPSGAKGPFATLLKFHPQKGLDFILSLLNRSAEKYAHSTLDVPRESHYLEIELSEPHFDPLKIHLDDGTEIPQHYSWRLWAAYRSHSVCPYLLQSALMALENWLIEFVELTDSEDQISWAFNYIIRNSNSVFATAVLASIATGFHEKVGKNALPICSVLEFYFMDIGRANHDKVPPLNWFAGERDPYAEYYADERRKSAQHPWREESLETLIVKLQFSQYKEKALTVIDLLHKNANDEESRAFLHNIDGRNFKPVPGPTENTIAFQPIEIEPKLEERQQNAKAEIDERNRYASFSLWATDVYEYKGDKGNRFNSWTDALEEAKYLLNKLIHGDGTGIKLIDEVSLSKAVVVFLRDYGNELKAEDVVWCKDLITDFIIKDLDYLDGECTAIVASVLPVLLDFAENDIEKLNIKELIIDTLVHARSNVRSKAAIGIQKHLWERDADYAQVCIDGAVEYARLYQEIESKNNELKSQEIDKFRHRFLKGEVTSSNELNFEAYSLQHLLQPCLMIPEGSTNSQHIRLLSQVLEFFFKNEQMEREDRSEQTLDYKVVFEFCDYFAKQLIKLDTSRSTLFVHQLRQGCIIAPSFMSSLDLRLSIISQEKGLEEVYWRYWSELSSTIQELVITDAQREFSYLGLNAMRSFIRGFLKADLSWQPIDIKNQDKNIALGKKPILEFISNAGKTPDVFEALAKLMYYFPNLFLEPGFDILAKHQKEVGGIKLFAGGNTSFCLEMAIQRYLQRDQSAALSKHIHKSILILLDALVEKASSRAYYIREHLIRYQPIG